MSSKRTVVAPESEKLPLSSFSVGDAPQKDQDPPEHKKALLRSEQRKVLITLADQVAQDTFYFRNYKYKGADKAYPDSLHALQRFTTKCYPYAKEGLLLVDEPRNPREEKLAFEKQKVLKALGFRHVVIAEYDAMKQVTLYDLMEQLGEI